MYKSVKTIVSGNNVSWEGLPAFVSAFASFSEKLGLLEQHAYNQNLALVGVSAVKDAKREVVADKGYAMASSIAAYAVISNEVSLINQMKISHWDLKASSRSRVLQHLDLILTSATEHVNDLGDFGVDQSTIDELQGLRDELDVLLSAPRNAIVERKVLTQQIKLLSKDIDALLKLQLDKLMVVLKADFPQFYAQYKSARIIIDHKATRGGSGEAGENEPNGGSYGL